MCIFMNTLKKQQFSLSLTNTMYYFYKCLPCVCVVLCRACCCYSRGVLTLSIRYRVKKKNVQSITIICTFSFCFSINFTMFLYTFEYILLFGFLQLNVSHLHDLSTMLESKVINRSGCHTANC